jgi:voltage-gated potassium channel
MIFSPRGYIVAVNWTKLKKAIFDTIQIGDKSNVISRMFDIIIVVVILANISVMFMQTYEELTPYYGVLRIIEWVTTGIFCVEYLLRIWTADFLYPKCTRYRAIGKFLVSYDGVVDLLTIIPVFFLSGFVVFRMLRVVRIFHLFRINSQYDSFNVIKMVLLKKSRQILSSVFIIFVLMVASSLCMYSTEHAAQPGVFRNAFSGIWWSVSTVLTVGYGDIYPITLLGKCMAIVIAFMGVLLVAIPTGIISAGFVEQYQTNANEDSKFVDVDEIGEVMVTEGSKFMGRTVSSASDEYGVSIYMVLRDKMSVLPTGDLVIEMGDILIIRSKTLEKRSCRRR